MKKIKILNLFLGVVSLLFGLLKFLSPFKDWYAAQIKTSGLPQYAYPIGVAGEIITGMAFIVPFLAAMKDSRKRLLLNLANSSLILILLVAIVVHLAPDTPAAVLPLKIKPPVIPLAFVAMAVINLISINKNKQMIRKPA